MGSATSVSHVRGLSTLSSRHSRRSRTQQKSDTSMKSNVSSLLWNKAGALPHTKKYVTIEAPRGADLGFNIRGGVEHGIGIYVSFVEDGSLAQIHGLEPGDQIMELNGVSFVRIWHRDAAEMIKSCNKLELEMRHVGRVPGAYETHQIYQWVDERGRSVSPPPEVDMVDRYNTSSLRKNTLMMLKSSDERKVNLVVEEESALGLMMRGGSEFGLGVYITGVDVGSVADDAELKAGDQILDVNGHSFLDITHTDAIHVLKSSHHLMMTVKVVGKIPHGRTTYDHTEWVSSDTIQRTHSKSSSSGYSNTSYRTGDQQHPKFVKGIGSQLMHRAVAQHHTQWSLKHKPKANKSTILRNDRHSGKTTNHHRARTDITENNTPCSERQVVIADVHQAPDSRFCQPCEEIRNPSDDSGIDGMTVHGASNSRTKQVLPAVASALREYSRTGRCSTSSDSSDSRFQHISHTSPIELHHDLQPKNASSVSEGSDVQQNITRSFTKSNTTNQSHTLRSGAEDVRFQNGFHLGIEPYNNFSERKSSDVHQNITKIVHKNSATRQSHEFRPGIANKQENSPLQSDGIASRIGQFYSDHRMEQNRNMLSVFQPKTGVEQVPNEVSEIYSDTGKEPVWHRNGNINRGTKQLEHDSIANYSIRDDKLSQNTTRIKSWDMTTQRDKCRTSSVRFESGESDGKFSHKSHIQANMSNMNLQNNSKDPNVAHDKLKTTKNAYYLESQCNSDDSVHSHIPYVNGIPYTDNKSNSDVSHNFQNKNSFTNVITVGIPNAAENGVLPSGHGARNEDYTSDTRRKMLASVVQTALHNKRLSNGTHDNYTFLNDNKKTESNLQPIERYEGVRHANEFQTIPKILHRGDETENNAGTSYQDYLFPDISPHQLTTSTNALSHAPQNQPEFHPLGCSFTSSKTDSSSLPFQENIYLSPKQIISHQSNFGEVLQHKLEFNPVDSNFDSSKTRQNTNWQSYEEEMYLSPKQMIPQESAYSEVLQNNPDFVPSNSNVAVPNTYYNMGEINTIPRGQQISQNNMPGSAIFYPNSNKFESDLTDHALPGNDCMEPQNESLNLHKPSADGSRIYHNSDTGDTDVEGHASRTNYHKNSQSDNSRIYHNSNTLDNDSRSYHNSNQFEQHLKSSLLHNEETLESQEDSLQSNIDAIQLDKDFKLWTRRTVIVHKTHPRLGLSIQGGKDTTTPIPRIVNIEPYGCAADTELQERQLLLEVNGKSLRGLTHLQCAVTIAAEFRDLQSRPMTFLVLQEQDMFELQL